MKLFAIKTVNGSLVYINPNSIAMVREDVKNRKVFIAINYQENYRDLQNGVWYQKDTLLQTDELIEDFLKRLSNH